MLVQLLFYAFAAVMLAAATAVILVRNPVYSALSLVVTFFSAASIWLLIQAEFLAIVLVLVYVGAVMVLFLFVVMMLDVDLEELRSGFAGHAWLGGLVALLLAAEIVGVIWVKGLGSGIDLRSGLAAAAPGASNTRELGVSLFTHYLYPFELAAMLLLVAIVVAIVLTMRVRHREGVKVQDVAAQVAVRREERVRVLQMPPEKRS
ncbi:MAG: NADH-quinone oxidoreductase subunit J [Nevskiaceae bacterium]|nr:NADH-quinone oxidoreductase subunit J [Nevskiaceae bacterium]